MNKTTQSKKIIIVRESIWESIVSDFGTFAFIAITVWFNQNYCGGSWFLNGVILVMFIITCCSGAISKMSKKFDSRAKAIKYLQSMDSQKP
jgi:hypothetical protein